MLETSAIPHDPPSAAARHRARRLPPIGLSIGLLLGVLAPYVFVNQRLEPDGVLRLPPLLMAGTLVAIGLALVLVLLRIDRQRVLHGSAHAMAVNGSLREDLAFCLLFLFATLAAVWHFNFPYATFNNAIFGSEYGFIAESLVRGEGFADAFNTGGGATAWMPPMFVWILAGAFWLFGIKTATALWAMIVLKVLGLALALLLLLRTYPRSLDPKRWYPGVLFFVLAGMFPQFFLVLHDVWLILLLAVATVYAFSRLDAGRSGVMPLMLVLSVALPLTSPALALAFVAVWAVVLLRKAVQGGEGGLLRRMDFLGVVRTREARIALMSGIVFTLAVCGWTARNGLVVGTFAPIKCNFWFDFYQANAVDDDGCISPSIFFRFHPLLDNPNRKVYEELGEVRFLERYQDLSREFLSREPGQYARKLGHRLVNAFLFTDHAVDLAPVDDEVGARDLARLQAANLVGRNPHQPDALSLWTVIQFEQERFESELSALGLEDPEIAATSWSKAKRRYERRALKKESVARSLAVSLLPTLAVLLGLLSRQVRRRVTFLVCATIYVVYLSPYVVAAHYWRYQLPLLGVHTLLLVHGLEAVLELLRRFKPARNSRIQPAVASLSRRGWAQSPRSSGS